MTLTTRRSYLRGWPDGNRVAACWEARALRLLIASGIVALTALIAGPVAPASAHATLLFTTPAVDGAVPTSPAAIQLVFDQGVVASGSTLTLSDQDGRARAIGETKPGQGPNIVLAPVRDRLEVGEYLVHWEVLARDGDSMVGEFRFAVGSSEGLALQGSDVATEGVVATSVLRWLMFAGLALALGGFLAGWLAARSSSTDERLPRPWVVAGSLVGLVAAAGLTLLVLGSGSVSTGIERFSLERLVASTPGAVALVEVGAFAVAMVLLGAHLRFLAGLVLLVVPVAEGLRAHPQAESGTLGLALTAVHLVAAAIWIGALVHVVRVGFRRRRSGVSNAGLVTAYARWALALFMLVLLTGVVAGLVLVPVDELGPVLADTGYGRWLLAKLCLVILVAALAGWARRFLARRTDRDQPSVVARYEAGALVMVLGISGVLTALAPPTRSDIPLPFPPPAVGPVVAVGSRAGFIGVGVSASQGQLLVRLYTPDVSAELENRAGSTRLAGNVTAATADGPAEIEFRRCGQGCFVAPVAWAEGQSTLTLNAEADGWAGGTAAVQVAWPPRPAAARLKAAVGAMRGVPHLTLHEQVTSDTTSGLGALRRLRLTGQEFLDSEPYGSGLAPNVTRLFATTSEVTLALGYPGEGTYVLLTLSGDDRILRETLVSASHLVTRTFVYDEPDSHEGHDHDHPN